MLCGWWVPVALHHNLRRQYNGAQLSPVIRPDSVLFDHHPYLIISMYFSKLNGLLHIHKCVLTTYCNWKNTICIVCEVAHNKKKSILLAGL